jgi:hypothetical protein
LGQKMGGWHLESRKATAPGKPPTLPFAARGHTIRVSGDTPLGLKLGQKVDGWHLESHGTWKAMESTPAESTRKDRVVVCPRRRQSTVRDTALPRPCREKTAGSTAEDSSPGSGGCRRSLELQGLYGTGIWAVSGEDFRPEWRRCFSRSGDFLHHLSPAVGILKSEPCESGGGECGGRVRKSLIGRLFQFGVCYTGRLRAAG